MPPADRRRRKSANHGIDTTHWSDEDRRLHILQKKLQTPVAEMKLSVRVVNILENYDVIMVADLVKQEYQALVDMTNLGEKTIGEIKLAVKALGLPIPEEWSNPVQKPPTKPVSKGKGLLDFW